MQRINKKSGRGGARSSHMRKAPHRRGTSVRGVRCHMKEEAGLLRRRRSVRTRLVSLCEWLRAQCPCSSSDRHSRGGVEILYCSLLNVFIYLKHIFEFATCLYKISNFELEPCVTLEFDLRCFIRKKNIHHKILCRGLYLHSWVCCTPSPHRQHTCSLVFKFLLSLTFYAMFESLYYWKY
jgi:hypothetical protein